MDYGFVAGVSLQKERTLQSVKSLQSTIGHFAQVNGYAFLFMPQLFHCCFSVYSEMMR